jgi:hypothetical protein
VIIVALYGLGHKGGNLVIVKVGLLRGLATAAENDEGVAVMAG